MKLHFARLKIGRVRARNRSQPQTHLRRPEHANVLWHLDTQLLAQQICRPFYKNNVALGSSVVASITSSTPLAQAAVAGKNATDQSSWPQCAVSPFLSTVKIVANGALVNSEAARILLISVVALRSIIRYVYVGIPLLSHRSTNVRMLRALLMIVKVYHVSSSSSGKYADVRIGTRALGYLLCANYSGISTLPSNSTTTLTNVSVGAPSPSPFTGQAATIFDGGKYAALSVLGLLALLVAL